MIGTYACFAIANFIIPIRVSEEEEAAGLDFSMHNESLSSHPHTYNGSTNVNSLDALKELERNKPVEKTTKYEQVKVDQVNVEVADESSIN